MALPFARLEFVKRSESKNAVCKSAYLDRVNLHFNGTKFQEAQDYCFSYYEKPVYRNVYLPDHVDKKFEDTEVLWNLVEQFERRKDSQVAMDVVLALPDDKIISLEDKILLAERFLKTHFISKGYGVQVAIHKPDKRNSRFSEEGSLEVVDHNWHCHVLITPRTFNDAGNNFSAKKILDLLPSVRGASHFTVDAVKWGKIWTQIQNDFFEEKGLSLRVDHEGVMSQDHLGPVRMRGSKLYSDLEQHAKKIEVNQKLSRDPEKILEKLTGTKSVFTIDDVENYLRKHVSENDLMEVRDNLWKCQQIVELFKVGSNGETIKKFSTAAVIEEEKRMMRLSDRIHATTFLSRRTSLLKEKFKAELNDEQKVAFEAVISGQGLSCIEGYAGTGKSYLLVALKNFYESCGVTVRAFGPDAATVRVLEEKGFSNVTNVHRFLFSNHFSKNDTFSKNEVWIIDEAGKLGNKSLLELLKQAEKSGAGVIFSGNSAQLSSVERGGMFKKFCERYGCSVLVNVQRQKLSHQREISQKLAQGNFYDAINMISSSGGFSWSNSKETAILNLVEMWAQDRAHYPYSSQLVIAHSNSEVHAINEIAHLFRKSRGEVLEKEFLCETDYGKIKVSEGDLIEFRENNAVLHVSNGLKAILIKASEEKFVLKTQGEHKEREITFDPRKYSAYQLGYATTYFRSQGSTVDRAYVLYSRSMNKPLFYVGLTRHVRNAHCFVSRTDARFLSEIKFQALRENVKESSLDYVTQCEIEQQKLVKEAEDRIDLLVNSENMLDRIRGGCLKTWYSVKSQVSGYIEKVQDRRDSQGFYNVQTSRDQTRQGSVIQVKQENLVENRPEIFSKIQDDQHGGLQNKAQETLGKPKNIENKMTEHQKKVVKCYFDKAEEASSLYSIVKSEAINSNSNERGTSAFAKWQSACTERNKAAHSMFNAFLAENLKEFLGEKSFEILKDRAERYEKQITPKVNLGDQLRENLEPLLYKLFPEGPSSRDSRGFRFGAKGSFAVICKGDKSGCFYDFEKSRGGNIFQLIQAKLGLNELEAKEWANKFLNNPAESYFPRQYSIDGFNKSETNEWVSIIPPDGLEVPPLREISNYLNEKYILVAKHPYYDEKGNLVQYNLRLQSKGDSKEKTVLPLSFGSSNKLVDQEKWGLKKYHFSNGRNPIYNSNLLRENPSKPVLIVEGEKSADTGICLLNGMITISWYGGSGAVKKVDWSLLFGREVTIWPDNDSAGFKAAEEICGCLRRVGVGSLRVVDLDMLSKTFPNKWDIADPLPAGKDVEFLKECIQRAQQKAVGIDRLSSMLDVLGKFERDKTEICRLNEILWRIDERLRPSIEMEYRSKPWEIENRILSETAVVLNSTEALMKMATSLVGHNNLVESIAYQGMLYYARTGDVPSMSCLEEIKKALNICGANLNTQLQIGEKIHSYAFDRTCTLMIERGMQDKSKINEHFNIYVAEIIVSQGVEEVSGKYQMKQISIDNKGFS